ncbi:hypothetical protein YB2330_005777 [Saitoella coloradoensis]
MAEARGKVDPVEQTIKDLEGTTPTTSLYDEDEKQLHRLGYKQSLHRTYKFFENFAASFAALYFIGGIRATFYYGASAAGPAAYWSSYVITCIFAFITAAMLAEVCSALPAAGSIYFWAAESGGPKLGRLFGFIVAWWSSTAWTTFVASNCQGAANYLLSELAVFGKWTTDTTDIKFRAVQWAVAQFFLMCCIASNYLPPRVYKWIFKIATAIILLDFGLNVIWLPIRVSQTYGFQSAKWVFTETANSTGAPQGWSWVLSFFSAAGVIVGFDASGHVAEETKNASVVAARGLFWSAVASGLFGFATVILFLFCTPNLEVLSSLIAPQPFVLLYAMALGKGGHIFMNIISISALLFNTSVAIVASSRLVYAIARDGVLPCSGWIAKVSPSGQPRNAVTVIWVVAALILCSILPSNVAFTSLVSAAALPTIAAYALIAFGRLFLTPKAFRNAPWSLGILSKPFQVIALVWNLYILGVLSSPLYYPTSAATLNYAPVIFGGITLFAVLCWWFTPAEAWLRQKPLEEVIELSQDGGQGDHQSAFVAGVRQRRGSKGSSKE